MDQAQIHSHLISGRLNIAVHELHLFAQPGGAGVNTSEPGDTCSQSKGLMGVINEQLIVAVTVRTNAA